MCQSGTCIKCDVLPNLFFALAVLTEVVLARENGLYGSGKVTGTSHVFFKVGVLRRKWTGGGRVIGKTEFTSTKEDM